ncbi:MAG: MerR family transcriptional regulator [Paracoccus denitrificans]|nr:MAG: MerR family transcriptional regulator [Paracoccus denitrificans]PZO84728.1 MAG: MerR family transcriptional regulator [Paracoccus denitrificans]
MAKSPDAYRSIGEVARLIGVAPHVLRYWEQQFSQLSPVKRADGRRYYRPDDVRLAAGLCEVLRVEGLTIRGAKRLITSDRGALVRQRGAVRLGENAATEVAPARHPAPSAPTTTSTIAWLDRLAATAAQLRRVDAPEPAGLVPLAARLRAVSVR